VFLVVTLSLKDGSDNIAGFNGFMIQGQVVADNSAVGTWQISTLLHPVVQTICNGKVRS